MEYNENYMNEKKIKNKSWNILFKTGAVLGYILGWFSILAAIYAIAKLLFLRNSNIENDVMIMVTVIILYVAIGYGALQGAKKLEKVQKANRTDYIILILLFTPFILIVSSFLFGFFIGFEEESTETQFFTQEDFTINTDPQRENVCKAICDGHSLEDEFYYITAKYKQEELYSCFCYNLNEEVIHTQYIE